ncbi:MAG: hypothetical protein ABIW76_08210 [Fibrobacteria bacterium]
MRDFSEIFGRVGDWIRAKRLLFTALGVFLTVNFLCLPASEYIGDPIAIRFETVHLLNERALGVPDSIARRMGERGQYFFENTERGRWFPKYGLLNTLLYVPPLLAEKVIEGKLSYANPTRVIYLNIFNLLVGTLSVLYLYLISRDYRVRTGTRMIFLFAACFATFWWNYLRAQNSECYQVLFFLGFFYHFSCFLKRYPEVAFRDALPDRQLLLAMIYSGLLCHVKLLYVLILPGMPIIVALVDRLAAMGKQKDHYRHQTRLMKLLITQFALPALAIVATLGMVNAFKFGSPIDTGYRQWTRESQLFSGNAMDAFYGYFFSGQGSIFMHFPLLVPALFGYREFFRKHVHQAMILAVLFPVFLVAYCKFANWRGEWCYGPRYMLVFLPLLSLPFLLVWENLLGRLRRVERAMLKGFLLATLLASAALQVSVNSLPFMAYYQISYLAHQWPPTKQIDEYLRETHFGIINAQLLYSRMRHTTPEMSGKLSLSGSDAELFSGLLEQGTAYNYFWLNSFLEK